LRSALIADDPIASSLLEAAIGSLRIGGSPLVTPPWRFAISIHRA
jgi:hypothetical protein